jgi:copper(I)-binding protein
VVVSRPPVSFFVAAIAILVGIAGLVRGAVPQSSAASSSSTSNSSAGTPIVVGGAYVREPANGQNAAAYFTVFNTTDKPDQLITVTTGAGAEATLHTLVKGVMTPTGAVTIPAHGSVTLSPGTGHVMIQQLYGPLQAGQTVNIQLTFANAGQVIVTAPVIGITAPAPTAVTPR